MQCTCFGFFFLVFTFSEGCWNTGIIPVRNDNNIVQDRQKNKIKNKIRTVRCDLLDLDKQKKIYKSRRRLGAFAMESVRG